MSCRKKIDSKLWLDYTQTMETEVRTLKQELSRTRESLKHATKRCRDLVSDLDSRTADHDSERCLRDQQLGRILRALLVLESRLKQEQKSIRQLLSEKDNVIRNQQLEIAKLRRYTKNYIKCKREQNRNNNQPETNDVSSLSSVNLDVIMMEKMTMKENSREKRVDDDTENAMSNELGNDIRRLKREIIDKLNAKNLCDNEENGTRDDDVDDDREKGKISICCVRKTNSFAGSDISKASSSENTDAGSIMTTTTDESSASLLSTEGFCEGESTDCSPASTLEKTTLKLFINGTARRNDRDDTGSSTIDPETKMTRMETNDIRDDTENVNSTRRCDIVRAEPLKIFFNPEKDTTGATISRTESKDDGMDCNFASDDENLNENHEPIYVNSCNENNARNLRETRRKSEDIEKGKNGKRYNFDNNNGPSKLSQDNETSMEQETSGNWYSDPDEDKTCDDVFRHSGSYRTNGNHNSVLECVNQILLRDIEDEEIVLAAAAAPRRFKHRGRIIHFQPARLSDIESVGSEMERRSSDDCTNDEPTASDEPPMGNFEATVSEDEFGMRLDPEDATGEKFARIETITDANGIVEESTSDAIPIVVIEPKNDNKNMIENSVGGDFLEILDSQSINGSSSPTPRMERIEEKTCLRMSSRGLTIAKNLDYEDIESLPEILSPIQKKSPPALPPKPAQFRNTLILKKIPSPSFLIDETSSRQHQRRKIIMERNREMSKCLETPTKVSSVMRTARSLVFDEKYPLNDRSNEATMKKLSTSSGRTTVGNFSTNERARSTENLTPRVTNIVKHFEEFKIGDDNERRLSRHHGRNVKEETGMDLRDFDMRQNFEEFNLDDCDLSDDPNRHDGDGSERLGNLGIHGIANKDDTNIDNNNVICPSGYVNDKTYDNHKNGIYDNFLEATGLSNKSILTPSRLLSNHKSMLKPKDVKYKSKIRSNAIMEKNGSTGGGNNEFTEVRHWTGPFV